MDERSDSRAAPELERLRQPDFGGGAFRRIPLLPVVAVVTLFLGILVGYGVAPQAPSPTPEPTLGPTLARTSSPSVPASEASFSYRVISTPAPTPASPSPTDLADITPPTGGITLGKAIATVKSQYSLTDSQLIGAFLTLDGGIDSDTPPQRWVWVIAFAPRFAGCPVDPLAGSPVPSSACSPAPYTVVSVDYYTGKILP